MENRSDPATSLLDTLHPTRPGEPVSLVPYKSPEFFQIERERIFRRAWLNVGRVEDVPGAGDYIVREVEVLRASILIARGKDEAVRAFYNVCPHRGNKLVNVPSGSTEAFVCGYHSWTFNTRGALRGVPDKEMFRNLDSAKCGLRAIALEVWQGFIFVCFDDPPQLSLRQFLGPLGDYLEGLENINQGAIFTVESHLKCNWKIISDAFLEAYHIQALHRSTLKTMYSVTENRFGRLLQVRSLGFHSMNSMYGNPDHSPTPEQPIERLAYDPAAIAPQRLADIMRFAAHRAVNPTRTRTWSMDKNHVFPNTHFDFGPTGFWTHHFWPISVNETRHEARFYLPQPAHIRDRFMQEYQMAHASDVILEDLSNVERVQLGIESNAFDTMPLSDSEDSIRHSNNTLIRWAKAANLSEAVAEQVPAEDAA